MKMIVAAPEEQPRPMHDTIAYVRSIQDNRARVLLAGGDVLLPWVSKYETPEPGDLAVIDWAASAIVAVYTPKVVQ